jgi:molecular chaperone DnaK (HSP70)
VVSDITDITEILLKVALNTIKLNQTIPQELILTLMYTILVSMEKKKKQDALVVVGIDFGTTYSGYGYSFRDEYNNDHSKIFSNSDWKSGDGLVTTKTPTVILFDENGKFQSFGYEAEEAYTRLLEDGGADGYSYFSSFKMKLFQDEDEDSKELVHPILKVLR